jgi:hypothetical protein
MSALRTRATRKRAAPASSVCLPKKIYVCGWHRRSAVRCPVNPTNNGSVAAAELSLRTMRSSLRTGLLQANDLLVLSNLGRFNMSKKTAVELISRRRMLGILGAGVAFGIGAPAAMLTASEAEAQAPSAQTPGAQTPGAQPPGAPQTPGVDQRQGRPDNVTERRQRHAKRRAARHKALAQQKEGRKKRRMARRPGTSTKGAGPAGAGSTGTTGQGPARQ